jgi:branched-chain amino acid transport system ATP-binding protein
MTSAILATRGLSKHFGGLQVVTDVNFSLPKGEIHCLIGPNGAGKSTFFRLILGEHRPSAGEIFYKNESIGILHPHQRVKRGISVKFQVPGIFASLTAEHNLRIALQHHCALAELDHEVDRLLTFLRLDSSRRTLAGNLSHGQKQWLEIGMALALKPELLMLDEPTAGMSPDETYETGELVKSLNKSGMSVLAVEHDMNFVRQVAQRVTVLHFGKIFAQGTIDDIVSDERVAEIYLGHSHD